ncbi:type II toxin-antitoxin system HipA family toxin [Galbitalea soli]|uniref:Type II toxin-antitoxin system HipA family toxin n=1 Tax=Galbitalea soli TaxID=1268042 RepID=A0A7C9TMR7_9MICO|nr:type II toxin-antitoxin system HipA family toxin [Galbitalea soli]NEM89818.1 type II toxin-antitoxin system HipA family toxin [Galbitalea soli]NYJ30522.1 serine/threonine-protein kinase HipA [Galbitalea soli]
MSYQPVDAVEVSAWGHRVGVVAPDPGLGFYVFEYYPDWIARGIELAPLTMPARRGRWVFPALPEATFHRLPALLADSLPDDFGNALIDAWLAGQGVRRADITPLDRLAYMAGRAMGALEFRPSRGPRHRVPSAVELGDLVQGARALLGGRFASDGDTEEALQSLIRVGTSAGGARAKAVIAWNRATGEIRSGQLPADEGFEYWLVKLDGVGPDRELGMGQAYGRIEYAYHLMAVAAGIRMTECRLLEENGRAHFLTRRFDRGDDGRRIHTLTLCDLAEIDFRRRGANDYAQLFQAMAELGLGPRDRAEAFRRMAFNVLARNCDDHSKNHSFLLDGPGASWELSPAYDLTFAYNPSGEWTYQHLMAVDGRFRDIGRAELMRVADRFEVPGAAAALREVEAAVARWEEFAGAAGLLPGLTTEIRRSFAEL